MQWLNNPFVFPILIAGLISIVNALVVAQRRRVTGSTPLFGMLLAISWWSFMYIFELASAQQGWELIWAKLEYIGIVNVPVFFLLFSLEYSGYHPKVRRWFLWLWVVPLLTLILVWTNDYTGLIWSHIGQVMVGGYYLLALEHGFAFWIWSAYSYLCLAVSMIVLIGHAMRSSPEFKLQAAIIALGALVAMAGNILFLLKLFPIPDLDTTPISLTLTMVIYSIGLFRFGILDILEIASESILESMDDVVIVLNNQGYIVFVNKIFDYYFYVQPKSLIGKFAEEAFAQFPELQEVVIRSAVKRLKRDEIKINLPNFGLVFFDVAVSKIRGGRDNRELGRTIVLDDVTERRHAEKRIVDGPTEIPLILVYRASDERIIEVNRTFLLALGYERREVVGRSLSELGIWDPYKRSDFLRALSSEGSVKDYMLEFRSPAGIIAPYKFTATQNEIQGERYIVLLALETGTK